MDLTDIRAFALDHAVELAQPHESWSAVLDRARAFEAYMTGKDTPEGEPPEENADIEADSFNAMIKGEA